MADKDSKGKHYGFQHRQNFRKIQAVSILKSFCTYLFFFALGELFSTLQIKVRFRIVFIRFIHLNIDKSGAVSFDEFKNFLPSLGVTKVSEDKVNNRRGD
jgi:hypothetical protein